MAQLQRPAGRIIAVEIIVRSRHHGKNRFEMRIVQQRHAPLRDPKIGAADHADLSVGPGLRGDPIQGVVAVRAFLIQSIEHAGRAIAPAHILHDHGVAMIDERLVAGRKVGTFAVGSPDQNCGKAAAALRVEDVGIQAHIVAHRNAYVQQLGIGPGGRW